MIRETQERKLMAETVVKQAVRDQSMAKYTEPNGPPADVVASRPERGVGDRAGHRGDGWRGEYS